MFSWFMGDTLYSICPDSHIEPLKLKGNTQFVHKRQSKHDNSNLLLLKHTTNLKRFYSLYRAQMFFSRLYENYYTPGT